MLLIAALWTALGLLSAMQTGLDMAAFGEPVVWGRLVGQRVLDWYTCAIFTPVFFWLARHQPLDRRHWPQSLPVLLVVTTLLVVLKYSLYVPLRQWLFPSPPVMTVGRAIATNFYFEFIAFVAILGVVYAIEYARRDREREAMAGRLEARLSRAQLDVLRMQLQPHFLFNTLHAVSTLMHRDVEAADEMLSRLGDLLRLTIQVDGPQEVPLRRELEVLERYLDIMRVRFHGRLEAESEAAPELLTALVPLFLLQPLVENAIEHGVARKAGLGRVAVVASRRGDDLELVVSDDGPGIATGPGGAPLEGVGLSNTRARLAQLYGTRHQLLLENLAKGGLRATVRIPLSLAEAGPPERRAP